MNGCGGEALSVGQAVEFMKIQLKVQNLCPTSNFPKPSSGSDWSLYQAHCDPSFMFDTPPSVNTQ